MPLTHLLLSCYDRLPAAAFSLFYSASKNIQEPPKQLRTDEIICISLFLQYLLPCHCHLLPSRYDRLPAAAFFLFYSASKNIQEHPKQLRTCEIICISALFAIFFCLVIATSRQAITISCLLLPFSFLSSFKKYPRMSQTTQNSWNKLHFCTFCNICCQAIATSP